MRLLFVADGRSPIALNWIRYFVENGDEVYLVSTFACQPELELRGVEIVPVAFSGTRRTATSTASRQSSALALQLRTAIRHALGPLTITKAASRLREIIQRIQPDLIHAMRIPFEGMLSAEAYSGIPLLVSVWGNDFTLHAPSSALMRHYTSLTMQMTDGLHADCRRDIRLARDWGYSPQGSNLVTPGNGGIRKNVFYPPKVLEDAPIVINPRGFRSYVRNDAFFKAIPLVLEKIPQALFLCAAMADEPQALKWIARLGIRDSVELLAHVPHNQMGKVYRRAAVLVSPSVHDGTPNTLLEGIASGCFPIAGDLESIREWITNRENGLLVDPTNPADLASAILEALTRSDLRNQAAGLNSKIITERAEYYTCMSQAKQFYERLLATRV